MGIYAIEGGGGEGFAILARFCLLNYLYTKIAPEGGRGATAPLAPLIYVPMSGSKGAWKFRRTEISP